MQREKERFLKEHSVKYHITDWEIVERTEKVKRKGCGRPRKDEKTLSEMNYYLSGKVQCNDQMYMMERELCGLFVLITSLEDVKKHSSRYILERYKGQGTVERIFKFIKNPSWVGSFCLKKPERIAALGYLLLIAALIYTLWEHRVRKALSDPQVVPIDSLNQQKTKTPTTFALQKVMSSILILSQISLWQGIHMASETS
jgi:transposase